MTFVRQFASAVFGSHSYGENIYVSCPFAATRHEKGYDRSKSFSIREVRTAEVVCYCWACGFAGNTRQLYNALRDENPNLAHLVEPYLVELPEWDQFNFDLIDDGEDEMAKKPVECSYEPIGERWDRFPADLLQKWDVRYDSDLRGAACLCYSLEKGEPLLRGWQTRLFHPLPGQPKAHNPKWFRKGTFLYGEHIDTDSTVIIVEGPSDALQVNLATGKHVVACFGPSLGLSQAKRAVALYDKFVIFPDNDMAGINGAAKTIEALLSKGVDIEQISLIQYDGLAYSDPGACPVDVLRDITQRPVRVVMR